MASLETSHLLPWPVCWLNQTPANETGDFSSIVGEVEVGAAVADGGIDASAINAVPRTRSAPVEAGMSYRRRVKRDGLHGEAKPAAHGASLMLTSSHRRSCSEIKCAVSSPERPYNVPK